MGTLNFANNDSICAFAAAARRGEPRNDQKILSCIPSSLAIVLVICSAGAPPC